MGLRYPGLRAPGSRVTRAGDGAMGAGAAREDGFTSVRDAGDRDTRGTEEAGEVMVARRGTCLGSERQERKHVVERKRKEKEKEITSLSKQM
jgi:hypothetical protein